MPRVESTVVVSYQSAAEMAASYTAIRGKFFQAPPKPKPILVKPEPPPAPPEPKIVLPSLKPVPVPERPPGFSLHFNIINLVCQGYEITKKELLAPDRRPVTVYRRFVAMVVLRRFTSGSTPDIARWLGGYDHTTVLAGLKRVAPIVHEVAETLPKDATVSNWVRALRAYTEGELAINGKTQTIRDGSRTLPLLSYRRPERMDIISRNERLGHPSCAEL